MLKRLALSLLLCIACSSLSFGMEAMAKDGCSNDCVSCHKLTEKDANELLKKTGITVKSVKQAPARGLFELLVEKDSKQGVLFMDYGKKNLIQGMMVNLESLQPVSAHSENLPQSKQVTSVDVSKIPVDKAVVIGNPKGAKRIYVFTDPDCPYCKKAHAELKKLAQIAPDVAIYIMLYPLPMHPGANDKARVVLETMDLSLLDKAFEGKDLPKPTKDSSKAAVDEIIRFASSNGINGTPTIVMPDGRIEVGMRDAETLKKMLEK